ncbi:TetR family transcriptional regulator [Paraburkholderia sp. BCC1885]|uniref:TetR family transcriptional regulator n=1 Tax=Paraburkholderia sp. BCC1885 TaxID=2562669 RepID=UPI0011826F5A|nr:TetR family transcriptional regulator [Paraburkholderia sp. BCC1885]
MKRTRADSLRTRDRILDAAEAAFYEHGVSQTSLADIAEHAGLTRGAIYGHFRNKGEVFTAMVERTVLPMEMLFTVTAEPDEPDPLGRMGDILVRCLTSAATEPHSRRVFDVLFTKCEYTADMGRVLDRQRNAARYGRERIELGLRNAVAKGQLPVDLDIERSASLVQIFLNGALRDWLLGHGSIVLPRDARYIVDACLGMLRHTRSPAGHES